MCFSVVSLLLYKDRRAPSAPINPFSDTSTHFIRLTYTVHAANGYLPAQFLDSNSNKRTDIWGGSPEARAKFPLEVLKALIGVFGEGRVGVKINPAGGNKGMG